MVKLKKELLVKTLLESRDTFELGRPYLGMSQLGAPCKRALWYDFRHCYFRQITPRQRRIFNRGDLEEPRVLRELTEIDVVIVDMQAEVIGFAGHCKGHSDAIITNVPGFPSEEHLLLEIKTAKNSAFKKYKDGCKKANKQYYAQVQLYMYHLGLSYCLFIVTNKDTEERHYELIEFNEEEAEAYNDIAEQVIATDQPPPKIGGPEWFECKWCNAYQICHFGESVLQTCRTCKNAEIQEEGRWHCTKFKKDLTLDNQMEIRPDGGCYDKLAEVSSGSN